MEELTGTPWNVAEDTILTTDHAPTVIRVPVEAEVVIGQDVIAIVVIIVKNIVAEVEIVNVEDIADHPNVDEVEAETVNVNDIEMTNDDAMIHGNEEGIQRADVDHEVDKYVR